MDNVFECPDCGAPLNYSGTGTTVKCAYCGQTVVVPASMRPAPPPIQAPVPPPQQISIYYDQRSTPPPTWYAPVARPVRRRSRGLGCLVLFIGIAVAASLFAGLVSGNAGFLGSVFGSGIAHHIRSFGGSGTGSGLFQSPSLVAVDGQDNVYVADAKPVQVQKFDNQGKFLTSWRVEDDTIEGMTADHDGNLFITGTSGSITKYDGTTGETLLHIKSPYDMGGSGDFGFFGYSRIAMLSGNRLLALLSFQPNWVIMDSQGHQTRRALKLLDGISSDPFVNEQIAVDGLDNVYVLSTMDNTVYKLNSDGVYLSRIGSVGNGSDQFNVDTQTIAVDGQSRIYVSDWSGIQVFDTSGHYIGRINAPDNNLVTSMAVDSHNNLFALSGTTINEYNLSADSQTTATP